MALSYVPYTANGTVGPYSITFPYIERDDIFVFVNGVSVGFTFLTGSSIQLNTAAATGLPIVIRRITDDIRKVSYQDASTLLASDLNLDANQELYKAQETQDNVIVTVSLDGQATLNSKVLHDVAAPVLGSDAATKSYVDSVAQGFLIGTIPDGTLLGSKLASRTITSAQISVKTIGATEIADGSINTLQLSDNSITAVKLQGNSISTAKVVDGAITDAKLAAVPIRRFNPILLSATSNYTPSANLVGAFVRMVAPGGGGGGCAAVANISAAGGGGGGYTEKYYTAAQIAALLVGGVIAYSHGVPGAGGLGNANGNAGSNSAFGSSLLVSGGAGGSAGATVVNPTSGGSGAGGDLNIAGGQAPGLHQSSNIGGIGGNGPLGLGSGGYGGVFGGPGAGATGYGAGGGGACTGTSATARNGGAGAAGFCQIIEFLTA